MPSAARCGSLKSATSRTRSGSNSTIELMRQEQRLGEFAENAYKFDEVHVANDDLSNVRITKIAHG